MIRFVSSVFALKIMHRVLLGFRLSLFCLNHMFTLANTEFMLLAASCRVLPVVSIVVSSANFLKSAVVK